MGIPLSSFFRGDNILEGMNSRQVGWAAAGECSRGGLAARGRAGATVGYQ